MVGHPNLADAATTANLVSSWCVGVLGRRTFSLALCGLAARMPSNIAWAHWAGLLQPPLPPATPAREHSEHTAAIDAPFPKTKTAGPKQKNNYWKCFSGLICFCPKGAARGFLILRRRSKQRAWAAGQGVLKLRSREVSRSTRVPGCGHPVHATAAAAGGMDRLPTVTQI